MLYLYRVAGLAMRKSEFAPFSPVPRKRKPNTLTEGYRSGHNEAVLKNYRPDPREPLKTLDFTGFSLLFLHVARRLSRSFLANFLDLLKVFDTISYTESYRSGHNEAVLKTVCRQRRVSSNLTLSATLGSGWQS